MSDWRRQGAGTVSRLFNTLYGTRRHSAFTLVELLVVIAIMSMLISILLPALFRARSAGYKVLCQTRLKNLAYGWQLYLEANDETFYFGPWTHYRYGGWIGQDYWVDLSALSGQAGLDYKEANMAELRRPLNPFLNQPVILESPEDASAFVCPVDGQKEPTSQVPGYPRYGTSYFMNQVLVGKESMGNMLGNNALLTAVNKVKRGGVTLSEITHRENLILMGDQGWDLVLDPYPLAVWNYQWHDRIDSFNLAFLDGHVSFEEIVEGELVQPNYRFVPIGLRDN